MFRFWRHKIWPTLHQFRFDLRAESLSNNLTFFRSPIFNIIIILIEEIFVIYFANIRINVIIFSDLFLFNISVFLPLRPIWLIVRIGILLIFILLITLPEI